MSQQTGLQIIKSRKNLKSLCIKLFRLDNSYKSKETPISKTKWTLPFSELRKWYLQKLLFFRQKILYFAISHSNLPSFLKVVYPPLKIITDFSYFTSLKLCQSCLWPWFESELWNWVTFPQHFLLNKVYSPRK